MMMYPDFICYSSKNEAIKKPPSDFVCFFLSGEKGQKYLGKLKCDLMAWDFEFCCKTSIILLLLSYFFPIYIPFIVFLH